MKDYRLTLPNDVQTVPQLAAFVDELCDEAGLTPDVAMKIHLALEEAVVNVMEYAYPKGTQGTVDIAAFVTGDSIRFVITDSGQPFDPTLKEEVDTTLSVEDRPIGGLGIYLVKQLMDSISYRRIDGCNELTLLMELGDRS